MSTLNRTSSLIQGICIIIGLSSLGYLLGHAAIQYKELERTVTVKGLSEREYKADIVIWPIQFNIAGNDLEKVYDEIDNNTAKIKAFLEKSGIGANEISFSSPSIIDKSAQQYGNDNQAKFRYAATQTVTVYSKNIDLVRRVMENMSDLGKQGIVFTGNNYQAQTEYLFTRLNEVKPAREVAEKFASDSKSTLGKIKTASQGQFSISERDKNNPQIKKVRVVSTVTYYLSD